MRRRAAILALAACLLLAGCGSSSQPPGSHVAARNEAAAKDYLRSLRSAQARLAASERAIPRRPRTQRELVRAIGLLKRAIRGLSRDLGAIRAPAQIRGPHARLVAITRAYASSLAHAARVAGAASGELVGARLLSSATNRASHDFSATVAAIDRALAPQR